MLHAPESRLVISPTAGLLRDRVFFMISDPTSVGIRTVNRGQLVAHFFEEHVFAVTVLRHTINRADNPRRQSGHYSLKKKHEKANNKITRN